MIMNKHKSKIIALIMVSLFSMNFMYTVSADEEIIDDTFDPASFINIAISNIKHSPSTVYIDTTPTISFRASFSWPGAAFANDYRLRLIRDSDKSVLDTWTGTATINNHEHRDVTYQVPSSHTSNAGTFSYTIRADRMHLSQWQEMATEKVSITVSSKSGIDGAIYNFDNFKITTSKVSIGESVKGTYTISGKNLPTGTSVFLIRLVDITNDQFIGNLPATLSRTKTTDTNTFSLPPEIFSYASPGTITIQADLRLLMKISESLGTKSDSFTIEGLSPPPANRAPNTPSRPVGPTSVTAGQTHTYYFVTTDPDGDNVRYKYSFSYRTSDWTAYYASGSQASVDIEFPTAGTYSIEVQAQDIHGLTSGWSSATSVVVQRPGTGPAPEVVKFYAKPETIYRTGFTSLFWEAKNADSVTISHGLNPTNAIMGSTTVSPTETTTYEMRAKKEGYEDSVSTITVTVEPHPPIITINADKTTIVLGDSVLISWSVQHATRVEISDGVVTNNQLSGMEVVYPEVTTTYTATAHGTQVSTDFVTVYVYDTDGKLLTSSSLKDNPIFWFFIGMLVVFVAANILYFQKTKKIPPYRKIFGKIWAWIKNVEYEDTDKKTNHKMNFSLGDGDDSNVETIRIYRQKKKKSTQNKSKKKRKKKGGER